MKFITYYCLLPALASASTLINRTIDDTFGDGSTDRSVVYNPADVWTRGDTCQNCYLYPNNRPRPSNVPSGTGTAVNTTLTHNGTWHDTTYFPDSGNAPYNITVSFKGRAVYVYNILANAVNGTETNTILDFNLDGEDVRPYTHFPNVSAPPLLYNQLVYVNSSIPDGQHTLIMSTGNSRPSLVLFDRVDYTVEVSEEPSPSQLAEEPLPPSTPAVAAQSSFDSNSPSRTPSPFVGGLTGGIVGGFIAILVFYASIHIVRRYKAHRERRGDRAQDLSRSEQGQPVMQETENNSLSPDLRLSRGGTSSTTSLIHPSPSLSPVPDTASETLTGIAPYSDPKRGTRFSQITSKLHIALSARTRASTVQGAPSAIELGAPSSPSPFDAVEFDFTPASAAPPAHSVDVPNPALSVTGTDRSLRHAELTREIQALEDSIRDLHFPGKPGEDGEVESPQPGEMSRSARARRLREDITRLKQQLARERRLLLETTPQGRRNGKKVLTVVK